MFQLSDREIQIKESARRIAVADIGPRAAEVDRTEEYPWDNVGVLRDAGFMGMTLPGSWAARAPATWTPSW